MASSLNELNLVQTMGDSSRISLLYSPIHNLSNSLQIRWLAVIQFKNSMDKYWRSNRILNYT
ncbi:ANM_HP_G0101050.mRNA.1.CDS.1 [Saccharomyces cerevisiae]|nr:ANM_HP_G0101050.mRNA.1.CDS.1 [Saccharomyces cerevisiae]CAI6409793.1 ANM_HP_G0101050.mRNA.1.CDS.1 [Saccharomyces cerevisiae]